jgi:hypothetical protein
MTMETESKFVVIPTGKPYLDALKWINKGTAKVSVGHPLHEGIWSNGAEIFATNGYVIHLAELKPDNPFPVGNWMVRTIQPTLAVLERANFDAPDIHALIDKEWRNGIKPEKVSETYKLNFRMDERLLKTALDVRTSQNGFEFTFVNGPVFLAADLWVDDKYAVKVKLSAIIMPMHHDGNKLPVSLIPG